MKKEVQVPSYRIHSLGKLLRKSMIHLNAFEDLYIYMPTLFSNKKIYRFNHLPKVSIASPQILEITCPLDAWIGILALTKVTNIHSTYFKQPS